ncbi:unnamed protein product, partial [Owenia fusiformis]
DNQSVKFAFDYKGVIQVRVNDVNKLDADSAMDVAIETGAEDVEEVTEDSEQFIKVSNLVLCCPHQKVLTVVYPPFPLSSRAHPGLLDLTPSTGTSVLTSHVVNVKSHVAHHHFLF